MIARVEAPDDESAAFRLAERVRAAVRGAAVPGATVVRLDRDLVSIAEARRR